MILEKVDAQKKSFTLRFMDSDVVYLSFGADKYGYNEMKVEIVKKDEEEKFVERFAILYTWNPEMEEAPAFVMDMLGLINKVGKMNASESEEQVEEVEVVEEEDAAKKMRKCTKCEEMEDECECDEPEWEEGEVNEE